MGGEPFYHNVILQRLNAYHNNNGKQVYYSRESFLNVDAWQNIPLIFKATAGETESINHPDYTDVGTGQYAPGERVVGSVQEAFVSDYGAPTLRALLAITDPEVEQIARNGKLGLSTAFLCEEIQEGDSEDAVRLIGEVKPNHVLLFEEGACPNCWPNDGAAMFENIQSGETARIEPETRGFIKSLYNKFFGIQKNNTQPEQMQNPAKVPESNNDSGDVPEEEPEKVKEKIKMEDENLNKEINALKQQVAELTNTIAERDCTITEMKDAEVQRAKDAQWATLKNTLPAGWLGEREAETRAAYEADKDAFYLKLLSHREQYGNVTPAQGTKSCGCKKAEEQIKNIQTDVMSTTGFNLIQEE